MSSSRDRVVFSSAGVWIQPRANDGFWFVGTPAELLAMLRLMPSQVLGDAEFRVTGSYFPDRLPASEE